MFEFPIFSELPIRIYLKLWIEIFSSQKARNIPISGWFESIEPRKSVWGLLVGKRLFMPPIRLLTQENPEPGCPKSLGLLLLLLLLPLLLRLLTRENPEPGCPRSLGLRIQRPGQLSGQQQRAISTKFGNSTLSCLHTQHFHRSIQTFWKVH